MWEEQDNTRVRCVVLREVRGSEEVNAGDRCVFEREQGGIQATGTVDRCVEWAGKYLGQMSEARKGGHHYHIHKGG